MKTILIGFLFVLGGFYCNAEDYYYYKNEKLKLDLNTTYLYILCNLSSKDKLQDRVKPYGEVTKFYADVYHKRLLKTYSNAPEYMTNEQNHYAEIKLNNEHLSKTELQEIVYALKNDNAILNVSFHYNNPHHVKIATSNYLWVQLKDSSQLKSLRKIATGIDYVIMGQHHFMYDWVMLGAKKNSAMNVLNASAYLYENGGFASAEPDYRGVGEKDCVNDTHYGSQWPLGNLLFNGERIGITACGAWNLTTGSTDVDVAIIDEGFENNHPDLNDNLDNSGYNTVTGTSPTTIFGNHGTACAGIVAAEGNNSQGVSGVAYNTDIMSVALDFDNMNWSEISDGFIWAMNNGAEVLSNSWGWDSPSSLFDATVWTLLLNGRSAKGCLIVFSAGNINSSSLIYPKNSNPYLIITGAMSWCHERKNPASCDGETNWGSNYGGGLDIMAPGVGIYTTDRQGSAGYTTTDYRSDFNGTSSACPHIAGVAALILSVNPCLSYQEVENIIKQSGRKVGTYNYNVNITAGAIQLGTWNNEMGHGLVDAEAAVRLASTTYLQNLTHSGNITRKGTHVLAGYNVHPFTTNGNYNVTNSANVNILSTNSIDFQPGCDLQGTVNAQISSIGSCSSW